jgi:UDP-GlcNAc:undecaprenyl-phosphate GlcNAc-1-phosphate transferase
MQFARSLPVALLGLVLGLVLVPAIIQLSKRAGWYDVPDVRKWHRDPIPATGGIAIMVSLFAALLIAGNGRSFIMHHAIEVLGMAVLAFIGVFDDRKGVAPNVRFVVELLLAALVAANGTRITDMGGFLGMHALPVLPQYVLTVLVIVGLTNAFNLVDGIDGLAGSLAISTGAVLVGAALLNGRTDLLPLLLALSIPCVQLEPGAHLHGRWRLPAHRLRSRGVRCFPGERSRPHR